MNILSCASLGFPLCKKTAFVRVLDKITDGWKCPAGDDDLAMTDAFVNFLKTRGPARTNAGTALSSAFCFITPRTNPITVRNDTSCTRPTMKSRRSITPTIW